MNKTVVVHLNKQEVQECRDYHNVVIRRLTNNGTRESINYTGLQYPDRFFIGQCGELATNKWGNGLDLDFEWTVNDDGRPDDQDFIFQHSDSRSFTSDTKNTHHPRGKYLLLSLDQAAKKSHDVYVGASGKPQGDGFDITLWGVITGKELLKRPTITIELTSYYIELAKLPISMERFAGSIKKRRPKVELSDEMQAARNLGLL